MENMTALVSAFARAYHNKESNLIVYKDSYSTNILNEKEYQKIYDSMCENIKFFNPKFKGTKEEAIKWIVNKQIGPSIIGRSAFNKRSLENAIKLGCKQYLIYASGYDTSSLNYDIECLEIDKGDILEDKQKRIKENNLLRENITYISADFSLSNWSEKILESSYQKDELSFNSLLGISYYLSNEEFSLMLKEISKLACSGSSLLFDYQTLEYSKETDVNEKLAGAAHEVMKGKFSYIEIVKILENNNFLIYEYVDSNKMTKEFFEEYNLLNPTCKINAPVGVAYVLAVKK